MINNKILKFAALVLLAKFTFAGGYDSAYWSSREVVGGVSYTGDKVYNGGQSLGRYKGEAADGVTYVLPDLSGDFGTWVTTVDANGWGVIYGLSFDNTGTGFVVTEDNHLNYFSNGKYIKRTHTFEGYPEGVSYTGNAVYVVTSDRELHKCSAIGVDCHAIDTFNSEPLGVSFDANGDGFVVTKNKNLDMYKNDKFVKRVHQFNEVPMSISYTGNAVYVSTDANRSLMKCAIDGTDNCTRIYTFGAYPAAVSFDANGDGYVITDETRTRRINRFVNDRLVDDRLLENSSYHDVIM